MDRPHLNGMPAFTIIWFGQVISLIGTALFSFAIGIWLYQQTGLATTITTMIMTMTTLTIMTITTGTATTMNHRQRRARKRGPARRRRLNARHGRPVAMGYGGAGRIARIRAEEQECETRSIPT